MTTIKLNICLFSFFFNGNFELLLFFPKYDRFFSFLRRLRSNIPTFYPVLLSIFVYIVLYIWKPDHDACAEGTTIQVHVSCNVPEMAQKKRN